MQSENSYSEYGLLDSRPLRWEVTALVETDAWWSVAWPSTKSEQMLEEQTHKQSTLTVNSISQTVLEEQKKWQMWKSHPNLQRTCNLFQPLPSQITQLSEPVWVQGIAMLAKEDKQMPLNFYDLILKPKNQGTVWRSKQISQGEKLMWDALIAMVPLCFRT